MPRFAVRTNAPRRYHAVKAARARKVSGRRYGGVRRSMLSSPNKIYTFKRNVYKTSVDQVAGADAFGAMYFTLQDVPNYTEFTPIFDAYKIYKIKVRFIPQYNMEALGVVANLIVPKLFTLVDKNDATAATAINQLREYNNVKVTRGFREAKHIFRPAVADALYGGGVFTSYGMKNAPWISTTSSTVQHYGFKWAIDAGAAGQAALQRWDVECVYYMKFKAVK